MIQLYINDSQIELAKGEQIILNKSIGRIGEFNKRRGTFTNDFEIKLTAENKRILDFSSLNTSRSTFPYLRQEARLRQRGTEIARGFIQLVELDTNKGTATLSFFADNVPWFQAIKGLSLRDLDLDEYNHGWTLTGITSSWNNDEGYIYPLIADDASFTAANTEVENWYPCVYQKTIIKRIFESIGYKVGGTFTDEFAWKNTIIPAVRMAQPFSAGTFGASEAAQTFQATTGAAFNGGIDQQLTIDTTNDPGIFSTTLNRYTAATTADVEFNISGGFTLNQWAATAANPNFFALIEIRLLLNGVESASQTLFQANGTNSPTNYTYSLNWVLTRSLTAGDEVEFDIALQWIGNTGTEQVQAATLINDFTVATAGDTDDQNPIFEGQRVVLSYQLPGMTQLEFIKEMMIRHGLVAVTDDITKTVNFHPYKNVFSNKSNAVDWSGKIDSKAITEVNYTDLVQNYGKLNTFAYAEDESDETLANYRFLQDIPFGDGRVAIANEWIADTYDFFTSQFSATVSGFSASYYIPYIERFEYDSTTRKEISPRILFLTNKDESVSNFSGAANITITSTFGGVPSIFSSCPYAYFSKRVLNSDLDKFVDSLSWQPVAYAGHEEAYLLERWYKGIISVWNAPKYIEAKIRLFDHEYANFDFLTPVFIDTERLSGYFIVDEIEDFDGRMATVKLIQMP